ncbi:MAG TPA: hypothetical protein VGR36_02525 [Candidatus Acidoferrales bacterium]|nr:hypothetical protein [Candidatus Acidoferrales bacterium]
MPKKHCTVKPNHRQRLPTCRRQDLEQVFSLQFERTVSRDNTVSFQNLSLQIQPVRWRGTLAGCTVTVHQHLEGTLSLRYGRHIVGRYNAQGWPLLEPTPPRKKVVEKPLRGKPKAGFPLRLEIPQSRRDSHFPTATTTAGD